LTRIQSAQCAIGSKLIGEADVSLSSPDRAKITEGIAVMNEEIKEPQLLAAPDLCHFSVVLFF